MRYRWFAKEEDGKKEAKEGSGAFHSKMQPPKAEEKQKKKLMKHGERAGMALSIVVMLYAVLTEDWPLGFFCLSVATFMLRPLARAYGGRFGEPLSGLLQGFSLSLAFGTLIWVFL